MDKLSELRSAVQSDKTVGAESSLLTPTTIDLAINRAYRKIGAMYKWEETREALKTSAIATHEYYDYPQTWRPNSVWKLTIDDQDYGDPIVFKDYLYEKENNCPSGYSFMWANYGKRYFVYPVPTADGTNNIKIWGFKFVDLLVDDDDITIFSYAMPQINEAIVLEAGAILDNKVEIKRAASRDVAFMDLISPAAKGIVMTAWSKITQEQNKLVKTMPQWDVPDYFSSGITNRNALKNKIGNF